MTEAQMLEEAIRMGSQSATQASRFMSLAAELINAINDAIKQLECGLPGAAKDILVTARKQAGLCTLPLGTDLVEHVMRSIANIREQNGAAPYDGWAAIHGKRTADMMRNQLREEAIAVLAALGIKKE
jgi:hypothetical protein